MLTRQWWHQRWCQQVTLQRVQRVSAWFNPRRNFCLCVGGLIRPILFRWHRSKQVNSDDGGSEVIEAILKARKARGKAAESLTDAWQCMDDQMRMIPAALCRSLEYLHGDMSYVLIGGPIWKIRRRQWSWWRWSSFWRWRFNLGTSDGGGSVRRGHKKGLLTNEVETAENTNKDRTARHKKIRAMTLIPC